MGESPPADSVARHAGAPRLESGPQLTPRKTLMSKQIGGSSIDAASVRWVLTLSERCLLGVMWKSSLTKRILETA